MDNDVVDIINVCVHTWFLILVVCFLTLSEIASLCVCVYVYVVNIVACYGICKYMNSVFSLKWWFLFLKGTNLFTDKSHHSVCFKCFFVSLFWKY